jgi:hypothetical protein
MRAAWVALLVGSSVALAEPLPSPAHLKLRGTARPLLGDQLKVLLPVDMQPEPVDATNSAGVRPSYRDEDRYSLELDDVRFTMIAYETYASIGTDFKAGVLADLKTQGENLRGAKLEKLPLEKPLLGYEVLPMEWSEGGHEFARVVLPRASRHSDMVVTCTAPNRADLSPSLHLFDTLHFFDRAQRAR